MTPLHGEGRRSRHQLRLRVELRGRRASAPAAGRGSCSSARRRATGGRRRPGRRRTHSHSQHDARRSRSGTAGGAGAAAVGDDRGRRGGAPGGSGWGRGRRGVGGVGSPSGGGRELLPPVERLREEVCGDLQGAEGRRVLHRRDPGHGRTLGQGAQGHPERVQQLFPRHPQDHEPVATSGAASPGCQVDRPQLLDGLHLLRPGQRVAGLSPELFASGRET